MARIETVLNPEALEAHIAAGDISRSSDVVEFYMTSSIILNRTTLDHEFFTRQHPSTFWLAGLLAADGCVHRSMKRWSLSQSGEAGERLVQDVRVLIGHQATFRHEETRCQVAHSISVGSPKMVSDLVEKFGIHPAKSKTLKWPKIDPAWVSLFVRGYFDGDGTVGVYDNGKGYRSFRASMVGTVDFISGASEAIPSGMMRVNRLTGHPKMLVLATSGRRAIEFIEWAYADDTLPLSRKGEIGLNYVKTEFPRWREIEAKIEIIKKGMAAGHTMKHMAGVVGEPVQRIYNWKYEGKFI